MYADYGAAAALSIYPFRRIKNEYIPLCIALEGLILYLNMIASMTASSRESYKFTHSMWHIASAAKCVWAAYVLKRSI